MWFFKKKLKLGYKVENHPNDKGCVLIFVRGTGLDVNNPVHKELLEVIIKDNIQEMYSVGHNLPSPQKKI
jgi:hypothetical protein